MTCASCVGRVERALNSGGGVLEASVNSATETALVRYVAGDAGYKAKPKSAERSGNAGRKAAETGWPGWMTLLAAILAFPVLVLETGSHFFSAVESFVAKFIGPQNRRLIQFVLTAVVVLGPGLRFYTRGFPALRKDGQKQAVVGDGTNGALAVTDIAFGTGTDIAKEEADVVLKSGDLRGAVNAFVVRQRPMRDIKQNLTRVFGHNILLIPVAAGVLYPIGGVLLSPVLAARAMALSSLFVLTNALHLRWVKPALQEIVAHSAASGEPLKMAAA